MDGANGTSVFPDASARTKTPTNIVLPVAIDTANPKFGSASANFTGGYLWYAPSPDFDMGAGDFTVEMWAKFNDASLYSRAFLFYQADVNGLKGTFGVSKTTSDLLSMSLHSDAGTFVFTGTVPVSRNVWYHLAMVRSGNTLTLYKNGAVELSGPISGTVPVVTSQFGVGIVGEYIYGYGGYYGTQMMGWLDDFRITKGVARYTGPFTPPAAALADH
jgi:hypothetical protein